MSDFTAPSVTFSPGFGAETSTYRTAHGLLASRAPREALELLDPAIAADPSDRGLRSLRAWAYLIRVQLQKAEALMERAIQAIEEAAAMASEADPLVFAPGGAVTP